MSSLEPDHRLQTNLKAKGNFVYIRTTKLIGVLHPEQPEAIEVDGAPILCKFFNL